MRVSPSILMTLFFSAVPYQVNAQGVPIVDAQSLAKNLQQYSSMVTDLNSQMGKKTNEQTLEELREGQLEALTTVGTMMRRSGPSPSLANLETGTADTPSVQAVYHNEDNNPGTAQIFGDATENVEQLIIRVAKETVSYSGVSKAGLSVVQWRCLLQALIKQESRFQVGARSHVGAFGLTQIMPATASDLGINPEYYDSPYIQVKGGARYLANMLNMFSGNIIHALAAYNAGPGNVQKYGGVPPFKETQHYVVVIPQNYNSYLARVGGIDALGSIDPALMAGASMSMTNHGAGVYGDYSLFSITAAAQRLVGIINQIETTDSAVEALQLNTYARAELVRLTAIRTRILAAKTTALSSEQLAMVARQNEEHAFFEFTLEDLE